MTKFLTEDEIAELISQASSLATAEIQQQKDILIEIILMLSQKLRNEFLSPNETIRIFLTQLDRPESYLSKILGSRSRASEILAGKRNLSISDLRALRDNLGIPPDLLLGYSEAEINANDCSKYPIPDLEKYKFIPEGMKRRSKGLDKAIEAFFKKADFCQEKEKEACLRQSIRKNEKSNVYSLKAWLAAVKLHTVENPIRNVYTGINNAILHNLVKLSALSDGPLQAMKFLNTHGIHLVIMPHFQKTYLDGAIFKVNHQPVVALTLRYDRLDNFWHTLLHELSHLFLNHLEYNATLIDDMEIHVNEGLEKEADDNAKSIYTTQEQWDEFIRQRVSVTSICAFANKLGISPAIIAGRFRYETGKYKMYNTLIGCGEVRRYFPIFQKDTSK